MVIVMITNNSKHALPTVLCKGCQRCVDLEMEHSCFTHLSFCRQYGAEECWKGLLDWDPIWFCVWGSTVLCTCQGAGKYKHQGSPTGMSVYCLATTRAQLSLQKVFFGGKQMTDTFCRWSAKSKSGVVWSSSLCGLSTELRLIIWSWFCMVPYGCELHLHHLLQYIRVCLTSTSSASRRLFLWVVHSVMWLLSICEQLNILAGHECFCQSSQKVEQPVTAILLYLVMLELLMVSD